MLILAKNKMDNFKIVPLSLCLIWKAFHTYTLLLEHASTHVKFQLRGLTFKRSWCSANLFNPLNRNYLWFRHWRLVLGLRSGLGVSELNYLLYSLYFMKVGQSHNESQTIEKCYLKSKKRYGRTTRRGRITAHRLLCGPLQKTWLVKPLSAQICRHLRKVIPVLVVSLCPWKRLWTTKTLWEYICTWWRHGFI